MNTVEIIEVTSGALTAKTGRVLLAHIDAAQAKRPAAIVVDLGRVTFMDSMGIALLVSLTRRSTCRVVLAGLNEYVSRLAKHTHLHDVFDVYATAEAARFAHAN